MDGELRPIIHFVYFVHGQDQVGSAAGILLRSGIDDINDIGDAIDATVRRRTTVQVRYDPDEASQSYFLNSDNPHFTLEIDDTCLS